MIMEGLETLVTPSHHAYLLTESAAAAHFNVLSFDTCSLFKTAATTAGSYNLNNNNHATANNNNHSQTQLISSHHHQQQMQQPTIQSHHQQQTNTVNTSNSSNTSSHSATSVTQSKSDSTAVSSSTITTTTSTSSGHHNHPTLNIQETHQQTADRNVQQHPGDLNTPVTTSGDIPSFFGSSVVEPPIITGELKFNSI
jgi:hypothetical protein